MSQSNWLENHPLVIHGLGIVVKDDIHCLSDDIVYGTILKLLAQFQTSHKAMNLTSFVNHLTIRMVKLAYNFPLQGPNSIYTSKPFGNTFAYVSAKSHTLQQTYRGPFKILKRHSKYFTVGVNTVCQNNFGQSETSLFLMFRALM